jgi:hypothetical protein
MAPPVLALAEVEVSDKFHTSAASAQGKAHLVRFGWEAGWARKSVCVFLKR